MSNRMMEYTEVRAAGLAARRTAERYTLTLQLLNGRVPADVIATIWESDSPQCAPYQPEPVFGPAPLADCQTWLSDQVGRAIAHALGMGWRGEPISWKDKVTS